ncbi:uncharacterized protein B0H64DRAFT_475296 [Chaetomium fimeti]|uniref:Uncharacterized protein n=1 Tax=Chaetomium fimeti TaxID=1854472 RepID=A0AAE0HHN4_9PEZI|nr:hypothetical protein B0H64DRAFT_475296 [Chaetomium fimeti]
MVRPNPQRLAGSIPPTNYPVYIQVTSDEANGVVHVPTQAPARRKGQPPSQGLSKARRYEPYAHSYQQGHHSHRAAREADRRKRHGSATDGASAASQSGGSIVPRPTNTPHYAPRRQESFWFYYASAFVGELFKNHLHKGQDEFAEICLLQLVCRHSDRIGQFELWARRDALPRVRYLEIDERYRLYLTWNEDAVFDMEDAFENLFRCATETAEAMGLSAVKWSASKSLGQIVEDNLADVNIDIGNLYM